MTLLAEASRARGRGACDVDAYVPALRPVTERADAPTKQTRNYTRQNQDTLIYTHVLTHRHDTRMYATTASAPLQRHGTASFCWCSLLAVLFVPVLSCPALPFPFLTCSTRTYVQQHFHISHEKYQHITHLYRRNPSTSPCIIRAATKSHHAQTQ